MTEQVLNKLVAPDGVAEVSRGEDVFAVEGGVVAVPADMAEMLVAHGFGKYIERPDTRAQAAIKKPEK